MAEEQKLLGEEHPDEEHPEEPRRKKKKIRLRRGDSISAEVPLPLGVTLGGAGVIGVIIVLVVWFVSYRGSSQSEVPNLVGIPRAEAEAQIRNAGLNLKMVYEEPSDQPVGMVLRSDPAAGTKLDRGAGVNLIVAAARPVSPPVSSPVIIPIPVPGNSAPAPGYLAQPSSPALPPVASPPPVIIINPPTTTSLTPVTTTISPTPTTTSIPTTTPPPTPVILGVGRVNHPDPKYHDCATGYRFNFSQQVSMTQPGRVTYRWLRSDGAGAPIGYIDFANPGTQVVTDWWQRSGAPGDQLTGWEQIEILTPVSLKGERLSFSYTCPSSAGGSSLGG